VDAGPRLAVCWTALERLPMNVLWLGFRRRRHRADEDWLVLWPEATPCRTGRRGLPAGCVRRRACLVWTSRAGPYALPSLLAFAEPGHILFGRDYPWAPTEVIESFNDPRFRCRSPGVAHR
jgi:hypothetical protein